MDEYYSELMLGGFSTIFVENICEDSLLAAPLMLDLIVLAELCKRIEIRPDDCAEYTSMHPVLSVLSYLLKAPLVPSGNNIYNIIFKEEILLSMIILYAL